MSIDYYSHILKSHTVLLYMVSLTSKFYQEDTNFGHGLI